MSIEIKHRPLWRAAIIVAVFDFLITAQIFSFIHYCADWRCGTGAYMAGMKVTFLSLVCAPAAAYGVRACFRASAELGPKAKLMTRLPLTCFGSLMFTFFVVFPIIRMSS